MARITDVNEIHRLFLKATNNQYAESTRKKARAELVKINERQRARANERLYNLRRSEYAYGNAYDNAQNFIEQHYGKDATSFYKLTVGDNKDSLNILYSQALAINSFLSSPQSMVKTQKAIEQKRFETFKTREDIAKLFKDRSDEELREFLRFMGNESVGEYLNFYDESATELESIVEMYDDENKREKLTDLFDRFSEFYEDVYVNKISPKNARGISSNELSYALDALQEGKSSKEIDDLLEKLKDKTVRDYENIKRRRR